MIYRPINNSLVAVMSIFVFINGFLKSFVCLPMTSHCNRCFECNEELSTHCNKKALAQSLDFLQKHSVKAMSGKVFGLLEVCLSTDGEKSFY